MNRITILILCLLCLGCDDRKEAAKAWGKAMQDCEGDVQTEVYMGVWNRYVKTSCVVKKESFVEDSQ